MSQSTNIGLFTIIYCLHLSCRYYYCFFGLVYTHIWSFGLVWLFYRCVFGCSVCLYFNTRSRWLENSLPQVTGRNICNITSARTVVTFSCRYHWNGRQSSCYYRSMYYGRNYFLDCHEQWKAQIFLTATIPLLWCFLRANIIRCLHVATDQHRFCPFGQPTRQT